ncbi:hypothetical protein N7532_003206 [Penicillium argentinense]|uniref:Sugar phosphate transporter domain-containing protein n=1 Tax=Penicillium argentinense TaxID=1131581 RepID=A0A9W9KF05_9EURO|nr:uncharacterized protein N7532_003206 [Penicillium argentinense]KAJ5102677.1 hypothetical protein N7532_003206 [Penicillium argentinense]
MQTDSDHRGIPATRPQSHAGQKVLHTQGRNLLPTNGRDSAEPAPEQRFRALFNPGTPDRPDGGAQKPKWSGGGQSRRQSEGGEISTSSGFRVSSPFFPVTASSFPILSVSRAHSSPTADCPSILRLYLLRSPFFSPSHVAPSWGKHFSPPFPSVSNPSIRQWGCLPPGTITDGGARCSLEIPMCTPQLGSSERRDDSLRALGDGGHKWDEQEPLTAEDTDASDLSAGAVETRELDAMSSDDAQYDEETGLTATQKRQRRRRRRQRRKLDARIADTKSSRYAILQLGLADRNVLRKLLVNAGLILMWYFFSLSISIYNKWMFSESDIVFPFPLFTTSLHMAVQFSLATLLLWIFPSLRPQHPPESLANSPIEGSKESEPILTKYFYITRLIPCGAATSLDIGLGNMSLKFISLTFLTMCKSSALAFVLLFAFLFRLESPSFKLIVIIATMTIGVVMMVAGETAFNALGFGLVIASAFFSGFRWGLTQILLLRHPATSNPFSTLFLLTPVMFVSLITIALTVEGPSEIHKGYLNLAEKHGNVLGSCLLVFPGVLAFCMISSEFALLKRSSVVTLSICGIFKEVVTISAAGVIFHDKLTAVNISGLVITIGSIATYNYMKISRMRSEAAMNSWSRDGTPESDTEDGDLTGPENGDYQRVAGRDTDIVSSTPGGHLNDDLHASPAGDQRRSFRVRPSGAMQGLSISTTPIPEDDGPSSPIRSAPPTITTMAEAGFPTHLNAPDRENSPGVHSASSISPVRSQTPRHP